MLKMMKYEYKRALGALKILLAIVALIEVYFLVGTTMKEGLHTGIASGLLVFSAIACYMFVLIYGISNYNKDLKSKTGLLVFMTPVSTYRILGAKLLSILLTGITLVAVLFGLFTIDYSYAASIYHFDGIISFFKEMFESMGADITGALWSLLAFIVMFLIQFFMTTTMAYLAISLSSTVLQNKKSKGFVSFVLFIAIYMMVNGLSALIIKESVGFDVKINGFAGAFVNMLPVYLLYLAVAACCFYVSANLLEKKISL